MPRFYFDITNSGETIDDDGTVFPNAHAARDGAIRTLADLARDEIGLGPSRAVSIVMRNDEGHAIFSASLALQAQWLVETA